MLMVIDLKCNMRLLRTNVTHYQAVHVLEVYKCIKMDTIDETYFAAQLHSPPPVSCVCVCVTEKANEKENKIVKRETWQQHSSTTIQILVLIPLCSLNQTPQRNDDDDDDDEEPENRRHKNQIARTH